MSTAIVFVPAASSFFPGAAAAMTGGVGFPILLGAALGLLILSRVMEEAGKAECSCGRQNRDSLNAMFRQVEASVQKVVSEVLERAGRTPLSNRSREALQREIELIRGTMIPKCLSDLRDGVLGEREVRAVVDKLEGLDLLLVQHRSGFTQSRSRADFLSGKIASLLPDLTSRYSGSGKEDALKARFEEIRGIPEEDIEERIGLLEEFLGRIECISDGKVLRKVVDRLLAGTRIPGVAATGPGPAPILPPDEGLDRMTRLKTLLNDLAFYHQKLGAEFPELLDDQMQKLVSEASGSDHLQRVSAVRDQVKLVYQKAHSRMVLSSFFKDRLIALRATLSPDNPLTGRLGRAIEEAVVERGLFQELSEAVEKHHLGEFDEEMKLGIREKVSSALDRLNYVVIDDDERKEIVDRLSESRMALLNTKYDDYKLLLRMGKDDALSIRLVRVVQNLKERENISEFQKQKDTDLKNEWCHNVDLLREHLEAMGIIVNQKLRLEDDVQYLTIEQLEQQKVDTSRLRKTTPDAVKKGQARQRKRGEKSG